MKAVARLDAKFEAEKAPAVDRQQRDSFEEFLREDAMVPVGAGRYDKYSFDGSEALLAPVRTIDRVIGSGGRDPLADSKIVLAGGAQFGKTILELNLAAYCASQQFLNFGLYLPDDKLADTVIDTKFRPDVLDQIPWLARMTQVGKAVNASGKQVSTKKAVTMTDGNRRANIIVSGLQKPTTTITLDLAARDEEDDIPPANAKFVSGRLTNSKLAIEMIIGTQRVHGRGQQKAWENGSQGVLLLGRQSEAWQYEIAEEVDAVPEGFLNPEEAFPEIIRHAVTGLPRRDDPKLQWTGDFRRTKDGEIVSEHAPENVYYLADPATGEPLDRNRPIVHHRQPARIAQRYWSYRMSQLSFARLRLGRIVNQFVKAVSDPDTMIVFRCDVLALPKSTAQAITPEVIARAQTIAPFEIRMVREPGRAAFAGLDLGDKCWLTVREIEDPGCKRLIYATTISSADLVRRITSLAGQNLWDCLFTDQRPETAMAREIALALNGLDGLDKWPEAPKETDQDGFVSFPGGLRWNGRLARWEGLKCAVVRFDQKTPGKGISQQFDRFVEGGANKFVPLINCNRHETIERAVRELLTPDEGVNEVLLDRTGAKFLRSVPSMLLPASDLPVVDLLANHFILGSERVKESDGSLGDFKDKIENHFLLSSAYAALAETLGQSAPAAPFAYDTVQKRGGIGRVRSGMTTNGRALV